MTACPIFEGTPSTTGPLERVWFTPVTGADFNLFPGLPAVAGGAVVVPVPGGMVALDGATGAERWRSTLATASTAAQATLATARDSIACLVDMAVVGCVRMRDGAPLWQVTDTVGSGSTSTADHDALYYGRNYSVVSRDIQTGAVVWATDIAPDAQFHSGPAGIVVRNDTVFVCAVRKLDATRSSLRGDLVALDRLTGKILWTFTALPAPGMLRAELWAPPLLSGNLAIVGELDGAWLIAVDVRTGQEVWRTAADPTGYVQTETKPTQRGDTIYVGSSDTHFYSLSVADGSLRWRTKLGFSIRAAALCGHSAILVPFGGGDLWTVDTRSRVASKASVQRQGDDVESQVAVDHERAYFMSMQGVYAVQCAP